MNLHALASTGPQPAAYASSATGATGAIILPFRAVVNSPEIRYIVASQRLDLDVLHLHPLLFLYGFEPKAEFTVWTGDGDLIVHPGHKA